MKRLLFINLLILIFTTNVVASVIPTSCSFGTLPMTAVVDTMNQHAEHQDPSGSLMDSQMMSNSCFSMDGSSVTDLECSDCQYHCHGNVFLPDGSNVQTVESIAAHPFLMTSLLSIDNPRLLKPPRLS